MDPELKKLLVFRIALPLLIVAIVIGVTRARGRRPVEVFGWRPPIGRWWWTWLVGWAVWVFVGDKITESMGETITLHTGEPLGTSVVRFLGMVILAPLSEELVFRGVFYDRLKTTRLGVAGAVLLTAVAFTLAHGQYTGIFAAQIFIDAILLALARWNTGSVWVPIAMHSLGNLYAYLERMGVLR